MKDLAYVQSKKALYQGLFLNPLKETSSRIVVAILALISMSISNVIFLLLVGPFLKALVGGYGKNSQILTSDLLPGAMKTYAADYLPSAIDFSLVATYLPLMLVLTAGIKSISTYNFQVNQQAVSLWLTKRYRDKLFQTALNLPYRKLMERSAGHWMSVIMNDVLYLQTRFSEMSASFLRDSFVVISCLATIFIIHWQTALAILLVGPLMALSLGRISKKIAVYSADWQILFGKMNARILNIRKRLLFIHSERGEEWELDAFKELNESYYQLVKKSLTIRASFSPVMEMLGFFTVSIMLYNIGQGNYGNSFGPTELLQFFAAIGLLFKPLKNIGEQLGRYQETKGALKQSLDSFYHAVEMMETGNVAVADNYKSDFRLNDFVLVHGPQFRVELQDFKLPHGKSIALIGPSGSGKTSFLKALAGLFQATTWEANCNQQAIAENSSLVSQKPFLFEASLRQNLLYGQSDFIDDSTLTRALEDVSICDELKAAGVSLDSKISAINTELSGGQLQRLTIARALVHNRENLLLDEATSAINISTEVKIIDRLLSRVKDQNKSLLFITHRTHALGKFDEVIYFEKGKIKFRGKHQDLMEHPEYRNFIASETN